MLFCDKHFEKEFLGIEKKMKFIGIPLFIIISVLFITPHPIWVNEHLFVHFISSSIGIIIIWHLTRLIIYHIRKWLTDCRNTWRITIQVGISVVLSVAIVYFLTWLNDQYYFSKNDCYLISPDNLKSLLITTVLFTLLINTLYEVFYLFLKLSHVALETEKYKKESIEAQYQNLTSRLNPHFLFNSLNTLTAVVEEEPKKAVKYIQELSLVYRYVLNSQKNTWVDIKEELKFTQSYIQLLKMRFEDGLDVKLDVCEMHQSYYILPLTVQLLIENAVKHNEISLSNVLHVQIFCEGEWLIVTNNKQKRSIMPSSTKVGLHNICERFRFLVNKEVIIEDSEKSFTVKIPLVKLSERKDYEDTDH